MADLGDTLPFRSDLYDKPAEQGGVLVNAVTAVLTITLPDGTTATPTVPAPSPTGKYAVDYVAVQSGRHVGQWLFTMSGGKTSSYVETFDVGSSLVSVDEAIAHLRAGGIVTSTADLEQLQWLCMVATDAVELALGRTVVRKAVTQTFNGGRDRIQLKAPAISVTSVTEAGSLTTDYVLDPDKGVLYGGSSTVGRRWTWGRQNVTVIYVAGYLDPPRIVRKVALNAIQGMWQSSQQASHPFLDEAEESVFAAIGALTTPEREAFESLKPVNAA